MPKLTAYLQKNWMHIAAAIAVGILQILSQSGVLTPEQANTLSIIAGALGLATTKNSGTMLPPASGSH